MNWRWISLELLLSYSCVMTIVTIYVDNADRLSEARPDSGEIEKHYFVSLSIEGLIVNGMTGAG